MDFDQKEATLKESLTKSIEVCKEMSNFATIITDHQNQARLVNLRKPTGRDKTTNVVLELKEEFKQCVVNMEKEG